MADEGVFRVPAMDIQQNWQEVLRYTLTMRVVSLAVLLACIWAIPLNRRTPPSEECLSCPRGCSQVIKSQGIKRLK